MHNQKYSGLVGCFYANTKRKGSFQQKLKNNLNKIVSGNSPSRGSFSLLILKNMSIYYLTKKKMEEMEEEYENLKKIKRENFSQDAPSFFEGEDLNPDFAFYEENLEGLNARIEELETVLKNHVIIARPPDKDKVYLGASVLLKENLSKEQRFKIVGTLEANPFEGKISNESPAGQAFLGKRVGDTVSVGTNLYKILKINYEEG